MANLKDQYTYLLQAADEKLKGFVQEFNIIKHES